MGQFQIYLWLKRAVVCAHEGGYRLDVEKEEAKD